MKTLHIERGASSIIIICKWSTMSTAFRLLCFIHCYASPRHSLTSATTSFDNNNKNSINNNEAREAIKELLDQWSTWRHLDLLRRPPIDAPVPDASLWRHNLAAIPIESQWRTLWDSAQSFFHQSRRLIHWWNQSHCTKSRWLYHQPRWADIHRSSL